MDENLRAAPGPDEAARSAVAERARSVLRPAGALARLDDVAAWLAAWQRTEHPHVDRPAALIFAGDHGVSSEGVSAYPADVTAAMLRALREGVATANAMARALGATLDVIDAGVGRPTGNIARESAMDPARFETCIRLGRDAVAARAGADLLVFGEMGIGNTTAAAGVVATIFGGPAEQWTGRGTGVDDGTWRRKVEVVERARARAGTVRPFDALREVGGCELVAIAGAIAEARARSIPVVLDGFVVAAAAATLEAASPGALEHCIAGHRSPEPGHGLLLEKFGMDPLLDLGMRLGEGSGALAAVPIVRLAAAVVTEVATFGEWGLG